MCGGNPSRPNVVVKGLPEPFARRSVEGDMGLRHNIDTIAESAGIERSAAELNINTEKINEWILLCKNEPGIVSEQNSVQREIDEHFARHAVDVSVTRHCGTVESVYTPMGETIIMSGKDLSDVPVVIGIGGPLVNSNNPESILRGAIYDSGKMQYLKPLRPEFYLDKKYIFASMGLIGIIDPKLSLSIMKEEITRI
jgi:uncharacterized protein (TIGR01319 family)